ncbi:MAG: amidase [Hyphomicrobiaceae bacterium]
MRLEEYAALDGVGLARLIARGEVTAQEVCTTALRAISKVDPLLNFAVETFPERVEALKGLRPEGPLAGVPTLLKDFFKFELGVKSECGCQLTEGLVGSYDSEVVLRMRKGGLVTLGRSTVPELGWASSCNTKLCGLTCNPWDVRTYPGGSSSGAAVAVASGAVPIAHASDGGGSTRAPAAYQGLVGLKPTRGRVSDGPGVADPNAGMSCHLAVTRTVRDTAMMLDVLSGPAIGDPHLAPKPERPFMEELGREPRRLKIAMLKKAPDGGRVDPEIAASVEATGRLLESMGHRVEETVLPISGEELILSTHEIWSAGMANSIDNLSKQLGRTPSLQNLTRTSYATYLYGKGVSASAYIDALATMNVLRRQMGAFFAAYDLLLTPTTAELALPHAAQDQDADYDALGWTRYMWHPDIFLPLYNITGNPAISLPLHQAKTGAQIGIHLVGRFGEDATLLRLAAVLEEATPWRDRRPPVHVCANLEGVPSVKPARRRPL